MIGKPSDPQSLYDAKEDIMQFIKDYTLGSDGVVLGVSGGLDSALVLELAIEALGVDAVLCIHMPYRDLDGYWETHLEKFNKLMEHYEVSEHYVVDITRAVDHAMGELDEFYHNEKIDKGNLMARIRMAHLYFLAREPNLRVIGTSNKTEIMAGYTAKWGDNVADLEPIAHLYKTETKRLAKFMMVPDWVIKQAPTAGLWEGQTDEGEMGITYDTLDQIFSQTINRKGQWTTDWDTSSLLRQLLYETYGATAVDTAWELWYNSRHKREAIPQLV